MQPHFVIPELKYECRFLKEKKIKSFQQLKNYFNNGGAKPQPFRVTDYFDKLKYHKTSAGTLPEKSR